MINTALSERSYIALRNSLGNDAGDEIARILGNSGNANTIAEFGAKSGGLFDCSTAINAALAASPSGGTLVVPDGVWLANSPIVVPAGISFLCYGKILYGGTGAAITVGDSATRNFLARIRINVERLTNSDWTREGEVGARLINPVNCEIDIFQAKGFTIGCQFAAYLACAYNYGIRLGYLINNKVGLDLRSFASAGFPNENSFLGGRFSYVTGVNAAASRYGIRLSAEAGGYTNHNNNCFYSPTFELSSSQASPGEAIPILIEVDATHNRFLNYRSELNTEPHIKVTGTEACRNEFQILYDNLGVNAAPSSYISWGGNRKSDVVESPEVKLMKQAASSWSSGDLPGRTVQRNDSGLDRTHTKGIHWEVSAGGGTVSLVPALHLTNNGEFLVPTGSSPAACICIDTRKVKRIIARKMVDATVNSGGRFAVRCYDGHPLAGGAIITSGAAGLVRGITSGQDAFWSAGTLGGVYWRGSDSDADWFFSVADSVKYIVLACYNCSINSFSVATPDQYPLHCFPLTGLVDDEHYLDAKPDLPSSGSFQYRKGQFVLNSGKTSSPGSVFGWYCTAAGTPGTWIEVYVGQKYLSGSKTFDFGSLAAGASQSTTVTVTGAAVGDSARARLNVALPDGFILTATVSAADTVKVVLANIGGATTDIASGTLTAEVFQ